MYALGARDAARNPGGQQHLVLLDIGGQIRNGVMLSATRKRISYAALRQAMFAYVDGYHSRRRSNAPVTIAIGTNNDLLVTAGSGRDWARRVVDPVRQRAARYAEMTIAGANDIEPGFRAGFGATQAWLRGYLANTSAPFVFNGSADGCSWSKPRSRCGGGWTASQLAWFAGVARPDRIIALPQVYNTQMAGQWAFISRTAALMGHRPLRIVGPLTENAACGRDPSCPTMPSAHAWAALRARFKAAHAPATSMPIRVDLDVH